MAEQIFDLDGRRISAPRKYLYLHGELTAPLSDAFYCEYCGHVYAKFPVFTGTYDAQKMRPWMFWKSVCTSCASHSHSMSRVPGSVWKSWDAQYLAELPIEILEVEATLHLTHWENINAATGTIQSGQVGINAIP